MAVLTVYSPKKKVYEVPVGETLLEFLRRSGYYLDAPCGGNGKCGKCRARVEGILSEKQAVEEKLPAGVRLLCKTRLLGDATVYLDSEQEAQVEMRGTESHLHPVCDRGSGYGVAVDIGTTTVVSHLVDLASGKCLAMRGDRNVQRPFGADVISRIDASRNPSQCTELHRMICSQIESMTLAMMDERKRAYGDLKMVAIAGNNTMELLFAGTSPASLAEYPFISDDLFGHDIPNPFERIKPARTFIIPSVQSFVGGDITSAVLASGMYQKEELSFLLDIGTNGEMVLGNRDELICCATAAGPAFEGADISCGMPGLSGAVDRVTQDAGGNIICHTIGDQKAIGICGSGLIDLLSILIKSGVVDETGRLLPSDEVPEEMAKYIDDQGNTVRFMLPGSELYLSDGDVRKLQLAKAAIRAGIDTLLAEKGISAESIGHFYLAGGFGCHINPVSAVGIGLFQKSLLDKIVLIGNGSAEGAIRTLSSSKEEKETSAIVEKCRYIDLSTNPIWNDQYIECMMFE